MGSVEQPLQMLPASKEILVYRKRQRKASSGLDDSDHQANKTLEELYSSVPEEPPSFPGENEPQKPSENDKHQEQQQEKPGKKPGKRRTKSRKHEDKSGKQQTNEEAALELQGKEKNLNDITDSLHQVQATNQMIEAAEPNSGVHESEAAKPSKPKLGFERRRKRQQDRSPEEPPESPPRKNGRQRKTREVSEEEKEQDDDEDDDETLEASRSRRKRRTQELCYGQEEEEEEKEHTSEDDERQTKKKKGKNSARETEKTSPEPPTLKSLKKCAAPKASPSSKAMKKVRSSEDGETLSIHETVQEKAQSAGGLSDAVHEWLNELGLLKYAEHFEMHEVDDGVLPLLTFEDLREMGISAVGSRRKMFTSIQGMGKKPQDA